MVHNYLLHMFVFIIFVLFLAIYLTTKVGFLFANNKLSFQTCRSYSMPLKPFFEVRTLESESWHRCVQVNYCFPGSLSGMDTIENHSLFRILTHFVKWLPCAVTIATIEHIQVILACAAWCQWVLKTCIITKHILFINTGK